VGLGQRALESLVSIAALEWQDRSVLVTGHTGFKGGWLALWLHRFGAEIHGYALDPPTKPSLFEVARVGGILTTDTRADLADREALKQAFVRSRPEVVFHLAAQPLVRAAYADPLGTLASNVTGTAHVLEAARHTESVRAVVVITTDKVYENREWAYPYREIDPLGGHDPYSASKAAAELITASYRAAFFEDDKNHAVRLATARAGNVLGDWATDRLVPDCLNAFATGQSIRLRNPGAVRPWQHVLEPLAGYLLLAQCLLDEDCADCARAWNFGPDARGDATVRQVASTVAGLWGENTRVEDAPEIDDDPHEAGLLRLDSTLARTNLCWNPRWSLDQALERAVTWHKAWLANNDMRAFSLDQIAEYERVAVT